MTKSSSRKTKCMTCDEWYFAKKPHVCKSIPQRGTNQSIPQKTKSNKLIFGRGKH